MIYVNLDQIRFTYLGVLLWQQPRRQKRQELAWRVGRVVVRWTIDDEPQVAGIYIGTCDMPFIVPRAFGKCLTRQWWLSMATSWIFPPFPLNLTIGTIYYAHRWLSTRLWYLDGRYHSLVINHLYNAKKLKSFTVSMDLKHNLLIVQQTKCFQTDTPVI